MPKRKTYFEQFVDYFKTKVSYKILRMEIMTELKNHKKIERDAPKLETTFLEQNFSFFIINAGVFNLYFNRKSGSLSYLLATTVMVCSYTYLVFMFYGEERMFYRNALRQDEIGLYLRKKSIFFIIFA